MDESRPKEEAHLVLDITCSNLEGPDECLPNPGCGEGFLDEIAELGADRALEEEEEEEEAVGCSGGGEETTGMGTVRERGEGAGTTGGC